MDPIGDIGQILEQGQQAAANTVQNTAKNTVSDVSSSVKTQITGNNEGIAGKSQALSQGSAVEPSAQLLQNGDFAKEMVSDFYSPSSQNTQAVLEGQEQAQTNEKLSKVRQELKNLHMEVYYNPLTAYENKKPEERPAESVERQKMEDLKELQLKEQQKAPPIAVKMAQTTTEVNRGVAG